MSQSVRMTKAELHKRPEYDKARFKGALYGGWGSAPLTLSLSA